MAQRLLHDEQVPQSDRDSLRERLGAFLLGNIAADARVGASIPRERTHFYTYGQEMVDHPWKVMLNQHPYLLRPTTPDQQAFAAGYIAHLSMDEIWSRQMVGPHFFARDWGSRGFRFLMLHIILIYMDERDERLLETWQPAGLISAKPNQWVEFLTDADLVDWRDAIYEQIKPGGQSKTLEIFGQRIMKTPDDIRAILDSEDLMQSGLWNNIPQVILSTIEDAMYDWARQSMCNYLARSAALS
jgi:hypothetical protein